MSNKAVTQMTDPEYTVEFDGEETYVMRNGVKQAMLVALGGQHLKSVGSICGSFV